MGFLELKVPPVLVFFLAFAGMVGLSALCPIYQVDWPPLKCVAAFIALVGMLFALAATHAFKRYRTTILPHQPHKASTLVSSGVFSLSRNPMYLSLALVLLALSIWLGSPLSLIFFIAFVAYITRFQIVPEERALTELFGNDYQIYQQKVPRWF